jgi:hypothetical protein
LNRHSNSELDFQSAIKLLTEKILEQVEIGNLMPIVLIDGRAGSGKSTFASELQNQLFKRGESVPRVIHMDDIYEGWQGLAPGSDYLQRSILVPLANRDTAHYQEWDWAKDQRGTWREFSGGTPLIIEGCGSLSKRSSEHAFISIWLEADELTRRSGWKEREGNDKMFDNWAAQELDFYAREESKSLANFLILNS